MKINEYTKYIQYEFKDLRIQNLSFGTSISLWIDSIYCFKIPEYYHTLYYRTVFIDHYSNYKPLIFCID